MWVIGLDMLEDLPHWYRAADLVSEFDFLVAMRPCSALRATQGGPCAAQRSSGNEAGPGPLLERATAALRAAFGPAVAERLTSRVLPTPLIDISSTTIRARVAAGESIDALVPPGVAQYVREHGLYRVS